MTAVWTWKNQLPAQYPHEIFYGKIKGGIALLMEMDYLAHDHFQKACKDIQTLNHLARYIYNNIVTEIWDTMSIRKVTMEEVGCTRSQFDTAHKNLRITMNVARLNEPRIEKDTWVPFREMYLDIWKQHVND